MVVLTSLRGAVWDYYAVEIALIGALSVKSMPSKEASPPRWLWGGVALYALVCIVYAASLWRFHDVIALRTRLYEEAQRRGDITIHEVSRAPFGYTGWKLFDSMVKLQKAGDPFQGLAAFLCELNEQATLIESRPTSLPLVQNCEGAAESAWRIAGTVQGRILWQSATLDLLVPCTHHIPTQSLSQCLAPGQKLGTKIFPLSNEEWQQWIQAQAHSHRQGIPLLSPQRRLSG